MNLTSFLIIGLSLANIGCKKNNPPATEKIDVVNEIGIPSYKNIAVSTNKAAYNPGEGVVFNIDASALVTGTKVRYKYLNTVIAEAPLSTNTWKWKTPETDFKGYIAEIYSGDANKETIYATIGIDVSSNWTKFPRYGFLSKYNEMSNAQIEGVISNLNRYHINGLQFYDWHNKHHMPLPYVGNTPANSWKDVLNRDIYFNTVKDYITTAKKYNIKSMFYNLVYGAWANALADGVKPEWYIYTDNKHTNIDFHPLPSPPFLSNIYLLDPSNVEWQKYLEQENRKVYAALAFDGFHMDQVGYRGTTYKYDGSEINLANTFASFIDATKAYQPNKYAVMNQVSQYGDIGIAQSKSDFLYSEVWAPFDKYADLANIIKSNNSYSNGKKNSVIAAYMNYDKAENKGNFNNPGVLMTNAVIFAFGGSHIELGEHMLAKEYFPNDNLTMDANLKAATINYYDFLVGYQNLLRDGGTFNNVTVTSKKANISFSNWPGALSSIAVAGKSVGNTQVVHLLNYIGANSLDWRDSQGKQTEPTLISKIDVSVATTQTVKKVWFASPDVAGGTSISLPFTQTGNKIDLQLPSLKYWDMLVIEYQ